MSERITEDIVREHFKLDPLFSQCIIEEQKSKNPRIDKALSLASKSKTGSGKGRPEFIVSFPGIADLLIVVECKADISKHESKTRDQYEDYAVDGTLLYASHLSKQYDVIAIAASGLTASKSKVSHFFWPKTSAKYEERAKDKKLLSIQSYITSYKGTIAAALIEGSKITEKAVEYNEHLNEFSVPETERAIFFSTILVSLQDEAFRKSYRFLKRPIDIAEAMIVASTRVLEEHEVDPESQKVVLAQYGTLLTQDIVKSEKVTKVGDDVPISNVILRDLLSDVEESVFPLISGGRSGYDVLGRFYTEFIRYSGSDARTGLVLTPQHITRLFCEILNLTTKDVVVDPCCGTGGFLTAAMQYMWEKAGSDEETKDKIKSEQLVGVERRTDMFTHAISNMMMRGDGKSHIYPGDCFDAELQKKILGLKPTVAMLNPPYDVGAVGQLKFIEEALKLVEKGRCIAICQMSAAVQQKPEIIATRERLLSAHTLEAVMSMPSDLFHPVGVVTCVLVLKAHEPHPDAFKTYFGYWRDDGFVKRKRKGRISDGTWPVKKTRMVESFINRDAQPGFSIVQKVSASDEWCAEAYMKSDITDLSVQDFQDVLKRFIAFRFLYAATPFAISTKAMSNKKVLLTGRIWKEFDLCLLFDVKKGSRITKAEMEDGKTPFIGAIDINNGLTAKIDAKAKFPSGTLTVVYNGNNVAQSFLQPEPYCCTDDVNVLCPKFDMSASIALFITTIIRRERYRFNYGRKWGKDRMQQSTILLPSTDNGEVDFEFIQAFIDSLPFSADLLSAANSPSTSLIQGA